MLEKTKNMQLITNKEPEEEEQIKEFIFNKLERLFLPKKELEVLESKMKNLRDFGTNFRKDFADLI